MDAFKEPLLIQGYEAYMSRVDEILFCLRKELTCTVEPAYAKYLDDVYYDRLKFQIVIFTAAGIAQSQDLTEGKGARTFSVPASAFSHFSKNMFANYIQEKQQFEALE
jgi:hypothetical protein